MWPVLHDTATVKLENFRPTKPKMTEQFAREVLALTLVYESKPVQQIGMDMLDKAFKLVDTPEEAFWMTIKDISESKVAYLVTKKLELTS